VRFLWSNTRSMAFVTAAISGTSQEDSS
jgi:hypothetical protein